MKSSRPVVLITGGASGIGRAAVLTFARAGYAIVFTDIKSDNADSVLKEIKDLGTVKSIVVRSFYLSVRYTPVNL